jgi:hypothetical protein
MPCFITYRAFNHRSMVFFNNSIIAVRLKVRGIRSNPLVKNHKQRIPRRVFRGVRSRGWV